jgi:hypothetical protein
MDFALIEEHPWATVAIIGGGGLLLYLYWRGGSSAAAAPQGGGGYAAADPSITAANLSLSAQQAQLNGQIAGLQIQGSTQIQLAQIGAGVSSQNIAASQETTDTTTLASLRAATTQTAAQLALGLGSQQSTVDLARIQAQVQMSEIDALVRAYGGTPPGSSGGGTVYNPPAATNPVVQITPVYTPLPNTAPAPQAGPGPAGGIIPGGVQLLPTPAYASCDPRDSACVNRNQTINSGYWDSVQAANAGNNRAQCLANAALSAGQPNYAALVAACG